MITVKVQNGYINLLNKNTEMPNMIWELFTNKEKA